MAALVRDGSGRLAERRHLIHNCARIRGPRRLNPFVRSDRGCIYHALLGKPDVAPATLHYRSSPRLKISHTWKTDARSEELRFH